MPWSWCADNLSILMLRSCALLLIAASATADTLDTVGASLLRSFDPALTGSGVRVAQVEVDLPDPYGFQVNPSAVGQPEALFTWYSLEGSAITYPNSLGTESWHGNSVAQFFFGIPNGIATGVAHVDNYEAFHFGSALVPAEMPIEARVINQSFTYANQSTMTDRDYDNYAARYNVLFVTGIGNDGAPKSPGTAYNSLGVGALGGLSSIGPTSEGRSKPEITVPSGYTSFSTPIVAGAAALLLQAAERGDAGPNIAAASDSRLLKALLINGAQKPPSWSNASPAGLDYAQGAGVLNVFTSWRQLRGGQFAAGASTQVQTGDPHPPPPFTGGIGARRGWDLSTISSSVNQDGIKHYFFDSQGVFNRTFTATLAWNRQRNLTGINNLDLFLYNVTTGALVASRISTVDNLEHLCVTNLPTGKYALQVWKSGGLLQRVSNSETYALVFDFGTSEAAHLGPVRLVSGEVRATLQGEPNTAYRIEGTSDFLTWSTVTTNALPLTGLSEIVVDSGGNYRFFRALELP